MTALRWKQRFQNFERAFLLLQEALENNLDSRSVLEKEGIIQRFQYTFELAWKTLNDYLKYQGLVLDQTTPRAVIKQAFASGIIEDGQIWITILEQRNLMAHTYNKENFEKAISEISQHYLQAIRQVYKRLKKQSAEE